MSERYFLSKSATAEEAAIRKTNSTATAFKPAASENFRNETEAIHPQTAGNATTAAARNADTT